MSAAKTTSKPQLPRSGSNGHHNGKNHSDGRRRILSLPDTTAHLLEAVHNHWINPVTREIWIHGIDMNTDSYEGDEPGVEYMMANRVIENLHLLRFQSATEPALIHLHTCGGIYEEGMAIYDTICSMPFHVTIVSYTHARSMSSIILQAADRRMMMPNSHFMFHYGTLTVNGEAKTVVSNVDFTKHQTNTMIDIYVTKTQHGRKFQGWTAGRIRRHITKQMDSKGDVFLTAAETVEWGFADEILTSWDQI